MKNILFYILIIFLFGLAPFGFINVLDTSVSLTYEVNHPRRTIHDTAILKDIDATEKYYNKRYYTFWTLTILGPVSAITLLLIKSRRTKKI
jgi:hypothetical protein